MALSQRSARISAQPIPFGAPATLPRGQWKTQRTKTQLIKRPNCPFSIELSVNLGVNSFRDLNQKRQPHETIAFL